MLLAVGRKTLSVWNYHFPVTFIAFTDTAIGSGKPLTGHMPEISGAHYESCRPLLIINENRYVLNAHIRKMYLFAMASEFRKYKIWYQK